MVSAYKLLDEAREQGGLGSYCAQSIVLPTEEGFTALAWCLPGMHAQWGGRIHELALDSACVCSIEMNDGPAHMLVGDTNGSHFELYALLGEAYGTGLPLGFLLLSSKGGAPGGIQ